MKPALVLAAALCLSWPAVAAAHGPVRQRIAALDARLAASPGDAALHDARGALHALDRRWEAAAADFEAAHRLDPARAEIEHRLANALLHAGQPARAAELLDAFLARRPDHVDAHLVRARAARALGRLGQAAADLSMAVELSAPPSPQLYLERAEMLLEAGDHQAALAALRDGIGDLGAIVALVERVVEIEAGLGRVAEALAAIASLPTELQRSPRWLARRASLLDAAGEPALAEAARRSALEVIARLPPSRRATVAMRALEDEIRGELPSEIGTPAPAPASWQPWVAALAVAVLLPLRRWRRRYLQAPP
jgi:tetratricopeptide (TPR) repeat protein